MNDMYSFLLDVVKCCEETFRQWSSVQSRAVRNLLVRFELEIADAVWIVFYMFYFIFNGVADVPSSEFLNKVIVIRSIFVAIQMIRLVNVPNKVWVTYFYLIGEIIRQELVED